MTATSYLSSDLSNSEYNYDLVVGVTADSINARLKTYLAEAQFAPKEIWYGLQDPNNSESPIVQIPPIAGVDPFSFSTIGEVPPALKGKDSNFSFAIKAQFGINSANEVCAHQLGARSCASKAPVPDIVTLQTSDTPTVTYNLFFQTLDIVVLGFGRGGPSWTNYKQPSADPVVFKFNVPISQLNVELDDAPAAVQSKLSGVQGFSVQQLYLDLNEAAPQDPPTIPGISSESPAFRPLQDDFVQGYIEQLKDKHQGILGYAATVSSDGTASSLKPTSLQFQISPYYDADGSPSEEHGLYALNYLMNVQGRTLDVGSIPFDWNWVPKTDEGSYDGAMAVRREIFANFLKESLSEPLPWVCPVPENVHLSVNDAGIKGSISGGIGPNPTPPAFQNVAQDDKILALEYNPPEVQSTSKSIGYTNRLGVTVTANAAVTVKDSTITVVVNSSAQLSLDWDLGAGDVHGRIGSCNIVAKFVVSVEANGQLQVTLDQAASTFETQGKSYHDGFLAGLDGTTDFADDLAGGYAQLTSQIQDYAQQVQTYLNSSANQWIFPGGQVFTFKGCEFSDNQDLVAHITYE